MLICSKCGNKQFVINTDVYKCTNCNYQGTYLDFKVTQEPKIIIELNKKYLTRNNKEVVINNFNNYYIGNNDVEYNYCGHDIRDNSKNDLIKILEI